MRHPSEEPRGLTTAELTLEVQRLEAYARGLGLDDATITEIQARMTQDAEASGTWGTPEDRLFIMRQRMLKAAL
ncbi:hypothetical protein FV222_00300 [Methylobacterium sp. WL103]|uniref:hypothetical protein n=1 Tax=Methylobacterium sp. WL103 TaxID=2603891 RepID=UPI0011CAD3C1|nr:hypothetical protein [Methylobacterium sp. WL103]TXN08946.1 hypothetical protein FV222_00300 [Methylobacterium sp. WL103]